MTRFRSYPPAETKIPASAFLKALIPQSGNFRKALRSYLGVENCVVANSGRALLYMLLSIYKSIHPERSEVLIPGYTCYSVAASVAKAGLCIRPYDLEPNSLSPDVVCLKQCASNRTLAIVTQHLFGIPTAIDEIKPIAKEVGAILIEDAAQALGGSLNGSLLGTDGDYGLFSFGRGKPLPLGSGGALVGNKAHVSPAMHLHRGSFGILRYAISAVTQVLSKPRLYRIAEMLPIGLGETVFEPRFHVGAMEPIMENLGNYSLASLSELNAHRTRIAGIYKKTISRNFTIPLALDSKPVYTRFPLMVKKGPISAELRNLGIRRMYPKAITEERSIYPHLAEIRTATPGAAQIARHLITLPTHRDISEKLAHRIADRVNRSYS